MHKRKLFGALALLLACVVLTVTVSYAWFSLSRAPEVTGVRTYIGANGSLEIALLSSETYADPSLIRTQVGDSLAVQEATVSNLTWGNVVDLSDESYGLNNITLYPSRLNVALGSDRNVVGSGILAVPSFGTDGRTEMLASNTLSAPYADGHFVYHTASQSYGVRGIGTLSGTQMTVQQAALAGARSLTRSYRTASVTACESAWRANGASLMRLYIGHYLADTTEYTDSDIALLRDTTTRLQTAVSYVDAALRQGVIGLAASVIEDRDTFITFRKNAENTAVPLSVILQMIPTGLPAEFSGWVTRVETQKIILQRAVIACDALSGGSYTWGQVEPILTDILDANDVYVGDRRLPELSSADRPSVHTVVTLTPQAGTFAMVADFSGNYFVIFNYADNVGLEVNTTSAVSPSYLAQLSAVLDDCEVADGDVNITAADLNDLYGYAVDLACRCNADATLQLQTTPETRVEGEEAVEIQGEGSYMQFSSEQLSSERMLLLMDAMRVGFMDSQNNLLAVAKLNISNYEAVANGIKAPLYLYDYTLSADGSISMGARRTENTRILSLAASEATIFTVVVWLDGDHVDNSLSAGTINESMTGSLNLQFSTDRDLHAADIPLNPTA